MPAALFEGYIQRATHYAMMLIAWRRNGARALGSTVARCSETAGAGIDQERQMKNIRAQMGLATVLTLSVCGPGSFVRSAAAAEAVAADQPVQTQHAIVVDGAQLSYTATA